MSPIAWLLSIIGAIGGLVAIYEFVHRRRHKPAVVINGGKAIVYLDGLPETPDKKRRDAFNKGYSLTQRNRYSKAIKAFSKCLDFEPTESERIALLILIGNCFFNLSELEEAEGHYKEAETAAKKANNNEGRAAALGNIGLIYQTKGELDKALDYHEQSLEIARDIGRKEGEANALGNIGGIHWAKREPDKALE
ncbi:MAG: tetratricopeptide repeat protein [Dehalococcoidia bacterium]|nr:tetratricopeptide repeat protein [Dehalococcoidia bacterium]